MGFNAMGGPGSPFNQSLGNVSLIRMISTVPDSTQSTARQISYPYSGKNSATRETASSLPRRPRPG